MNLTSQLHGHEPLPLPMILGASPLFSSGLVHLHYMPIVPDMALEVCYGCHRAVVLGRIKNSIL